MKIEISGGTPEQQDLCLDFAHHAALSLCGSRLYRSLDVELVLESELGHLGNAYSTDGERWPRFFEIELEQQLLKRPQLQVLAHELVHVKQLARGELRQLQRGGYSWKGKKFLHITPDKEIWSKQYNRLPWEIEARGMEEALFVEWCEDRGINDDWAYIDLYEH